MFFLSSFVVGCFQFDKIKLPKQKTKTKKTILPVISLFFLLAATDIDTLFSFIKDRFVFSVRPLSHNQQVNIIQKDPDSIRIEATETEIERSWLLDLASNALITVIEGVCSGSGHLFESVADCELDVMREEGGSFLNLRIVEKERTSEEPKEGVYSLFERVGT